MVRTWCIWASILILNFACTSTLSDQKLPLKVDTPTIIPPPKVLKPPEVIKIDPKLRLSIQDQIKWSRILNRMSEKDKQKILRMLLDGMFSDLETLESEGKIYPKRRSVPIPI